MQPCTVKKFYMINYVPKAHALNHTNLCLIWWNFLSKCTQSCDFTWDLNDYIQFKLSVRQVYIRFISSVSCKVTFLLLCSLFWFTAFSFTACNRKFCIERSKNMENWGTTGKITIFAVNKNMRNRFYMKNLQAILHEEWWFLSSCSSLLSSNRAILEAIWMLVKNWGKTGS